MSQGTGSSPAATMAWLMGPSASLNITRPTMKEIATGLSIIGSRNSRRKNALALSSSFSTTASSSPRPYWMGTPMTT